VFFTARFSLEVCCLITRLVNFSEFSTNPDILVEVFAEGMVSKNRTG
jgi:hypothetical protein